NLYFDVYVVDNIYKDIARRTSASLQQVPIESRDHQVVSDYFLSIWDRTMKPIINQDLQRLKIYEKSFINYHWQEFLRLLILDWGLPLALGIYSLYNLILCIIAKA
ncbi:hypothetical protein, partial [Plesiomonas shigelloides]|uniref:hypothetical protein n=1 Tax=Plesiomonas shigelloides TaxID=703 RepID=UPI001C4993C2